MGTYLINFLVYSMAMVGLLFVCLMVYKKTMVTGKCKKDNEKLDIENALNISPRKTLYVIKAGKERFLIAADAERTTFLSKLESENSAYVNTIDQPAQVRVIPPAPPKRNKNVDYSEVMNAININTNKKPFMKEILKKLDEIPEMSENARTEKCLNAGMIVRPD